MIGLKQILREERNNPEISQIIIEAINNGADLNEWGFTYWQLINTIGNEGTLQIIIELMIDKGKVFSGLIIFRLLNKGYFEIIEYLISKGFEPNFQDEESGRNALFSLVGEDLEIETLRTYLTRAVELGISPLHIDKKGWNLIHQTTVAGISELYIDELLKYNLDINKVDQWGWTPLHIACYCMGDGYIEKLVKNGAKIELRTRDWGPSWIDFDGPIIEQNTAYEIRIKYLDNMGRCEYSLDPERLDFYRKILL